MKKLLLLAVTVLFAVSGFAQNGIQWEHTSLQEALNKAKNNKKGPDKVFLDCFTSWCGPCKHMANDVFTTKEAGDYFNKNFVCIKIDMEKGEGPALAKKYAVNAYPTFIIMNSEGMELGRVVGGAEISEFIPMVEEAIDPAAQPENLLAKYNESKDMKDAYAYLAALEEKMLNDDITAFCNSIYGQLSPGEIYSEEFWKYSRTGVSAIEPTMLNRVLENKADYERAFGKEAVAGTIYNAVQRNIISYLRGKEELTGEQVNRAIRLLNIYTDGSKMDEMLVRLAKAYMNNDTEDILNALDGRYIGYTFRNIDIYQLQRILYSMKNIPDCEKARFGKEYNDFLQSCIEDNAKAGAAYKDVEIPARKGNVAAAMIMF